MHSLRSLLTLVLVALLSVGAASAQETTCEAGFHLFDHELLATEPVCIPDDAQRIVALDNAAAELLLFTDKEIVGTFDVFTVDELSASLPPLADRLATIPGIGWPANLELILEMHPDLIATYANDTMAYDDLSRIAPTVIFNAGIAEGSWQTATQFWSEVFGIEDIYEGMLATYDARIAELQTALGDDIAETELSLVLASSYFNMILTSEAPTSRIIEDIGLGRPEAQSLDSEASVEAYGNTTYAYLSDETLNLADGDAIIVFTFPVLGEETVAASDQYLADFAANPLWQSLSAVQSDQVFNGSFAWTRGNTYLLANAIIDDLFAFLTDTEATTPNPITALTSEAAS